MKQNSTIVYSILLVIGDFLAIVAAFVTAYVLRVKYDPRPLIEQIPAVTYLYVFLTIIPMWILVHGFIGLYKKEVYENRFPELGRLVVGSILGILVIIGYDFVSSKTVFPARLVAVYGLLLSFGFLVVFRSIMRLVRSLLFTYGIGVTNVLIVGNNSASKVIINELSQTHKTGHKIVGIVSKKQSSFYNNYLDFNSAIQDLKDVDKIIQTVMYKDSSQNDEIMTYAQTHHISYNFTPGNNELFVGNLEVQLFRGTPVVTVHQTPLIGWGRILKRTFDILISFMLIILFSPVFLIIMVLEKFSDSSSPIFFKQKRLTQFNKEFTAFKFRTHISRYNGLTPEQAFEKMGKPELAKIYRKAGDQIPNDPRVSKLGKILRVTSLDELPQLLNVLGGQISLVGPRALIPSELNKFQQKHHILSIKSGITGLAQVSGRKDISFEERRKLDLYYVQNWSFWLDITILLRTLRAVINGIGAK